MGNNQTKPPLPSQLQHTKDSRYGGNIMLDIHQTRAYQIFDIDQSNVDNFSKLLTNRKQLKHNNFITVSRTWVDDYRQQCSLQKMYRITVQYMYLPMCLEDQIKKYCIKKIPVPQPLIRKYFSQVVSCLEYLKSKGTCHGDVKPKNILIDKTGTAYLLDSYFINGGRVAFQIVLEDPQSLSLLSPGQLQSLKNKKFISLRQVHDDQMFGVGLSMMQAMTAQPAMQCYDLANLRMKPQFFNKKYSEMIACSYSPQLCQVVMNCVQFVPAKRIKYPQFLQAINMGMGGGVSRRNY